MKTLLVVVATLGLCVTLTGCFFRTTYRNLGTAGVSAPPPTGTATPHGSSWRHFFVYGLEPCEILIPADDICKSSGGVVEIRTQKTFLQALISGVQAFFIGVDIWSPWDGQVVCADDSRTATQ